MKKILAVAVLSAISFGASADSVWSDIANDHRNYYSKDSLVGLGVAFGVGGVVANTSADQRIQDWWQDDVRSSTTDDWAAVAKEFGEGKYMLPLSLALAVFHEINDDTVIGEYGNRMARAYLVGGLPMLAMQTVTGAGRPGEHEWGSEWRPLDDTNGVSGHAFIGAVPFITAAQMVENPFARYALYAASTATAISRVNDNQHYASQAGLGWFMAYTAAKAVNKTDSEKDVVVTPMLGGDVYGINISFNF